MPTYNYLKYIKKRYGKDWPVRNLTKTTIILITLNRHATNMHPATVTLHFAAHFKPFLQFAIQYNPRFMRLEEDRTA